ncbi:MAG: energy transducer TonB [Desulfarculaceae bacterium]|jgi:protein TonB
MRALASRIRLHAARTGVLLLALGINLAVFCAAPWLIRQHRLAPGSLDFEPVAYLVSQPPPPPEDLKNEPPPKPPPPILKMHELKTSPVPAPKLKMETPPLDMEINPSLTSGPRLAALPSLSRFTSGPVDRGPMIAARIPPPYPYFARRRGIEGEVQVRFLVDELGQVKNPQILQAKPSGFFENTVLSTVTRWKFKPGISQGRPIQAWVETTIRFKLE